MTYQSVLREGLFDGQTILVTGGGSGIGRCISHELCSLGAHVVLLGRKEEKLVQVSDEIQEDGGECSYDCLDIRDEDSVREIIALILKKRGEIHGLVNNAGGQFPSPLQKISKKGFDAVVQTNLTGGFLMAREVFNQSMAKTGGSIVNITAEFFNGMPGMGHSGAARAGMDNFTKTAAYEWGYANVRVNSVAPGYVASSGLDTYDEPFRSMIPKLKEAVPLKRLALEAEISAPVCFLLSPAAAFINGATIRVDGASSLGNSFFPLKPAKAKGFRGYEGFHRAVFPEVLQEGEDDL